MIPFAKGRGGKEPFSLRDSRIITKEVCERTPSKLSTYKVLGPGMILLENYVSLKDQVSFCGELFQWGFTSPVSPWEKIIEYMSFGRNWDPKKKHKNRYRSDGSEPSPIPYQLFSLAKNAIEDAQAHVDDLPSMCPDTCIVSFYPTLNGRLGLHKFYSTSSGFPVVSISIGETAKFVYLPFGIDKSLESVLLRSGDVLIYGGISRRISTEMTQIHGDTMPEPLLLETRLKSGWLNLALKQCDPDGLS
ncbi:DNA N(6)-methyladenine demethylase ALKBH1C-like [Bidens hawaiensis]|uniref:DNA N(6)-methyladenine demethylase ALKBH1C-like n=1 Tax=Bidens hawaiensis TaxID=980011 RepID=UPI00404ADBA9